MEETKINYQKEQEKLLKTIDKNNKPTLLLHVCCGPCFTYPYELIKEYFDITIIYNNSNIYPEEEYHRRLNELKQYLKDINDDELIYNAYNKENELIENIRKAENEKLMKELKESEENKKTYGELKYIDGESAFFNNGEILKRGQKFVRGHFYEGKTVVEINYYLGFVRLDDNTIIKLSVSKPWFKKENKFRFYWLLWFITRFKKRIKWDENDKCDIESNEV